MDEGLQLCELDSDESPAELAQLAGGTLVDLKTASKKPVGISSSHALQITTYAMLADQANGQKQHNAARL